MASRNDILAKLAIQIVGDNAKLGASLNQSSAQLKKFSNTVSQVGSALGIAFGTQQIISGIKAAIGIASQFEHTMSEVKAITGAAGDEFRALERDALRLGSSTKFTATEVGQLQVAYGRLGFTTKEIIAATAATLDLAAATGEDLAKSADVAGSTVRGFGLTADETQRVVDVMASSFNKTALGLENFTESMKYVAPVAAAAGATVEETTALLGTLADAGIRGSMAGTSLRKIFTDLTKDGRPLKDRLAELAARGITLSDSFDEVGRTAQTSLLILSKNVEKTDDLTRSFANVAGEAKKMALIMADDFSGGVERATSAWDNLIIAFTNTKFARKQVEDLAYSLNFLSGQGDSLDTKLEELAARISAKASFVPPDLLVDLKKLREELGKPIETPQLEFLVDKFKLTDEQAAKLYKTVRDINTALSLQEKTLADFKDLPYDEAIPAIEAYKQSLYELIIAQQIERDQLKGIADKKYFTEKIAGYQAIIDILAAYQLELEKVRKKTVDEAKGSFESISSLENKIKDLRAKMEAAPASDIPLLQDFERKIESAELKLANLRAAIAGVRDEIDSSALLNDPFQDPRSLASLNSNVVGGDAGTSLPQFSMPEVDTEAYFKSLENIENRTTGFVSDVNDSFVDLGNLISGALTGIAEEIGYQIASALDPDNVPTRDFGKAILGIIGQFAQQLGSIMIATGVGLIALESGNPYAMIAGGAVLVAAGAALSALSKERKNLTSKVSSGGGGSSGGAFNSGSVDRNMQNSIIIKVDDVVIKGSDMWLAFTNFEREQGYTHG